MKMYEAETTIALCTVLCLKFFGSYNEHCIMVKSIEQ